MKKLVWCNGRWNYGAFTLAETETDKMGLKPIDICHCICLGQYEHLHKIPHNPFFISFGLCQCEHTLTVDSKMAYLHWRWRTQVWTRIRIVSIAKTPTPYLCIGQESESESVPVSESGNVNESFKDETDPHFSVGWEHFLTHVAADTLLQAALVLLGLVNLQLLQRAETTKWNKHLVTK